MAPAPAAKFWKVSRSRSRSSRASALVTMSALQGANFDKLMSAVVETYDKWNLRVSTGQLNRWLEEMTEAFPPPLAAGRRVKIRYMTQVKARPPTFARVRQQAPRGYPTPISAT